MTEKRQEEVMHEFTRGEDPEMLATKTIRPYDPEADSKLQTAWLEGVIVGGREFVSHGKCFWIGDEQNDTHVSRDTLFVEVQDQPAENTSGGGEPIMADYAGALKFGARTISEAINAPFENSENSPMETMLEFVLGSRVANGIEDTLAFVYGKTKDQVHRDVLKTCKEQK